ncbi:phage minor head protein [Bordetella sp. BOR01]|uniref:phage minor head protein n=1 Tax=Bordetella sp. BOR01 TaxID=2854779 RepID=UPI001C474D1D|nr:phage head morphogenesis protein [Bordetella sp. BOR01]
MNQVDPTGVDRLERGAMREFARRMRKIGDAYRTALDRIPAEPVVNERYTFRLDQAVLSALYAELDIVVDTVLLEGGANSNWFLRAYVTVAYQRGTAQAYVNLAQQSEAYRAGRMSLDNLLRSPPYQTRVALLRSRVFEEMKGLSAQVKADMGRALADGLGRGQNPRVIAKTLTEQTGIETRRARRIARTEVPMALRRARWDEKDQAAEDYGVQSKLMHMSALSPTTRPTHAARHARLFTSEQVRDWYSQDGNAINCKCSQVEVLVDDAGKPLVPAIQERARRNYEVMKTKGKGAWTEK